MPSVRIYLPGYTAEIGDNVTLGCSINAVPLFPLTVSWQHISPDGQTKELNQDNQKYIHVHEVLVFGFRNLVIKDFNKVDEGTYKCTVSNYWGSDSASTYMTVNEGPPVVNMTQTSSSTEGDNVCLKCTVKATSPVFGIKWMKEEREIAITGNKYIGGSVTCPSIVIINAEKEHDEGKYTCLAENIAGKGSKSVVLTIKSKEAEPRTEARQYEPIPKTATQEQIILRHGVMVNDLSDYIFPEVEMIWKKFQQLIQAYVPKRQLTTNLHEIIQYLIEQEKISYGHYDKLYEVVYNINKQSSHIIQEAESDIKDIREGGVPNEKPIELECEYLGKYESEEQVQLSISQIEANFPEIKLRMKGRGRPGSIRFTFTISEANTPHELLALYLAETLKNRLENRHIELKDESDVPLVLKTSPRLMIPMKDKPKVRLSKGHYRYAEGDTAIVKCVVVSTLETEYIKWFRVQDGKTQEIIINNDKYIGGPKSPSLSISDAKKTDTGIYFCRAGNRAGEAESNTAFVDIFSLVMDKLTTERDSRGTEPDVDCEPTPGDSASGHMQFYPRLCHMIGYPFFCHHGFYLDKRGTDYYIKAVDRDSPAETVGLKAGDKIVEINGHDVDYDSYQRLIRKMTPGDETSLLVVDPETEQYYKSRGVEVSNCQPDIIHVTLSYAYLLRPRLCHIRGTELFDLDQHREDDGHYILYSKLNHAAAFAKQTGLLAGDRIVEVNGINIEYDSHQEVIRKTKTGGNIEMLVVDPKTDEYYKSLGVKVHSGLEEVYDLRFCYCRLNYVSWASFLGCGFDLDEDREDKGHYIKRVDKASPAKTAGLKAGDKIIEVNFVNIESDSHQEVIRKIKTRDGISLLVMGPITDKYQIPLLNKREFEDWPDPQTEFESKPELKGELAHEPTTFDDLEPDEPKTKTSDEPAI